MSPFPGKWCHFFAFISFLFFLNAQNGFGQYYLIGTDPGSVKWRQIKTPDFRVIYPVNFESEAQHVANGLEYNFLPGNRSLFKSVPKTPVVLHNLTTNPSSVTYIAPRRMEFFTAPPQDIYPQDWVDQLIIHEYRHAVQYSALNVGFTRFLYYMLGEQGVFGMCGLFLPMWFIEGDATSAETALHCTGRGRTPSFEMRIRAQFVDKGIYSYEKANYGSFADFVPGKYELGYQLVGWSRVDFGPLIWSKVINNVGRRPYTLVPFSSELKKQTGFNKYHLYDTITKQIQTRWLEEDKSLQKSKYQVITNTPQKSYTSYNLPVVFRDSLLIAVKSSLDDITRVVLINSGEKEKELFPVGINYFFESLSASDTVVYWSELVTDPRWLLRDYRVIKSYSFNSKKVAQLTHLTRYYAPSVSKDGKRLAAVEVTPENKYYLVILNSKDGSLTNRYSTKDNLLFIHPKWSDDGKSIVSIVFGKEGNNIAITDSETGETVLLLPYSFMEMKRPSFYLDYIIYTASYDGKDNIYALNRRTKQVYRVTSARFGASDATLTDDLKEIVYSDYSADGYSLVKAKPDTTTWNSISIPVKSAFPLAEELTRQEGFIFNTDSMPEIEYETSRYSKILNLFNFHSWAPVGVDLQNITAAPGATLLSQNLLGTTVTAIGYLYNLNENTGKYYLSVSDESLYTAIDFNADYTQRKDTGVYTEDKVVPERWNEFNLSVGLRLPLNWTHNNWKRSFQPAAGVNFKNLRMNESVPLDFEFKNIVSLKYSLLASNIIKTSPRDIFPHWSQQLQLDFSNTPFINSTNSIFSAQLTFDFPGLFRHHGIHLYGAYQKRNEDIYPFEDIIFFPRGYTEIERDEISSFSAMYSLPLFYPDWSVGQILYFKRFKMSLFYDFAESPENLSPKHFTSLGLDLRSDFSFLNLITPLDAGVRSIYVPDKGRMQFELLFSINFGGMY